jgi:hypothetical protein
MMELDATHMQFIQLEIKDAELTSYVLHLVGLLLYLVLRYTVTRTSNLILSFHLLLDLPCGRCL